MTNSAGPRGEREFGTKGVTRMTDDGAVTPDEQLAGFLRKYSAEIQEQGAVVLRKMRERLPNAIEMVYDNYNALVCGFSPSERPSEAVFSVVFYPKYISLCFLQGKAMPDRHGILRGNGNQVRWIRLESPETLDLPEVRQTMEAAIEHAVRPFDPEQAYQLVIRSISAKQRPRLPR